MVSFQCDGCGDVVTKPKLDKHYAQCQAPVNCLDCSKTFQGPGEYKSHTSCVSEAEKYQKGLYRGQKNNGGPLNKNIRQNGFTRGRQSQGTYQPWARNGSSWSSGRPGGYAHYEASGANGTPLGTPVRMSPIITAVPAPTPPFETNGTTANGSGADDAQKADEASSSNEKKKRRSKVVEATAKTLDCDEGSDGPKNKKAKRAKDGEDAVPPSDDAGSPAKKSRDKKSKDKKGKKEKSSEVPEPEPVVAAGAQSFSTEAVIEPLTEPRKKKERKGKEKGGETEAKTDRAGSMKKSKKSRKGKVEDVAAAENAGGPVDASEAEGMKKDKEAMGEPVVTEGSDAKSKKRKRAEVEANGNTTANGVELEERMDKKDTSKKRKKAEAMVGDAAMEVGSPMATGDVQDGKKEKSKDKKAKKEKKSKRADTGEVVVAAA